MRDHYKYIFLVVSLLLGLTIIQAQNTGNWQGVEEKNEAGKPIIKGKVVDQVGQGPLEYATLTLYSQSDSSMVTGGITNAEGEFKIETATGKYFAKIEFLSYETRFINNITLDEHNKMVDLGIIELNINAAVLDVGLTTLMR